MQSVLREIRDDALAGESQFMVHLSKKKKMFVYQIPIIRPSIWLPSKDGP